MTLSAFFVALGLLSMAGVALSLFSGLFAMSRGREKDHATSNRMMRLRVLLQGATLLFFLLAAAVR